MAAHCSGDGPSKATLAGVRPLREWLWTITSDARDRRDVQHSVSDWLPTLENRAYSPLSIRHSGLTIGAAGLA
ncbi:hypothetical protein RvY_13834 [Ramazzottius varieornatus]|uniref:Uncharacterized protein n=1 Tax=Ramazzottius varieornatus TaxID=947166 RepID=A0A1D1VRD9_RAMVA|nr:hypothetical protein RvY_13834 [Ramazzottius varieornatus]